MPCNILRYRKFTNVACALIAIELEVILCACVKIDVQGFLVDIGEGVLYFF